MSSDHDAFLDDTFGTAAPAPPPPPPVSESPRSPRSDTPGHNYFVKVTTPVARPVPDTTAKGTGVGRRGRLLTVTAIIVLILGGVTLLFTALRSPEVGSEEDLGEQIDGLQLPASLIELDEYYVADCPTGPCPSLVRWFDATAPVEVIRAEIISHMNASGVEVNENSASDELFSGRDETYIYFVVLDANMIARNRYAPPGTKAEISVQVLDRS
jgi:hypothetical protein